MTDVRAGAETAAQGTPVLRVQAQAANEADSRGAAMLALIRELHPVMRSITGRGLRDTIQRLGQVLPLNVTEVPTGTPVFDWTVPEEWSIEEAYLEHESGRRFADLRASTLHVVNYSAPVDTMLTLDELKPRLHSLPDRPDWIPYRTSYYKREWGFCLAHRELESLPEGRYHAVIRSSHGPGSMTIAEHVHDGATEDEVLVFAHDCHPALANDNLAGVAVAIHLGDFLRRRKTRYTYRFVLAPATIGSIAWLATHGEHLSRIRHGLVLSLLGDKGPLQYKTSRTGSCLVDRATWHVLRTEFPGAGLRDFTPWGYDERQFCSPGIDLPMGRLTRTPNGEYSEYHTSADTPDILSAASLGQSWLACLKIFEALEANRCYLNLSPKGEPQLGKRGLYRAIGGQKELPRREFALLWMLNQSDGKHSLLDIAERSGLPVAELADAAADLCEAALLAPTQEAV